MSAHGSADRTPDGVEIQPLLLSIVSDLRARAPEAPRIQRRLEARGLHAAGDELTLENFLRGLVESACEDAGSVELSLIAVQYAANHPNRPGPGAGRWLRIGLRRSVARAQPDDHFDQPGIPFFRRWDELAGGIAPHCVHHAFAGWSLAQVHLRWLDPVATRSPLATPSRILFVDDDEMILEVHRQSMESLGYDVVDCRDPHLAVALFERHPTAFDLLLSDCSMPGLGGDELTRRLRAIRPELPVILSSGFEGPVEEEDFDGKVDVLAKPFTLEELAASLARALAR